MITVNESLQRRFWQYTARQGLNDCWPWIGMRCKGYGKIKHRGKLVTASRASWTLHHGQIPDGLWVLHHCDNPECVNPAHLFLGTALDNSRDCREKGRFRAGQPRALTDIEVIEIRGSADSVRELACRYGPTKTAIWKIKRRITYKDVE